MARDQKLSVNSCMTNYILLLCHKILGENAMPNLEINPAAWLSSHKDQKLIKAILKGRKPVKAGKNGLFEKAYNQEGAIKYFLSSLEALGKFPLKSPREILAYIETLSVVSELIDGQPKSLSSDIYFRLRKIKRELFYNVCGYIDLLNVDEIRAMSPELRNKIYDVIYKVFSQIAEQYEALRKKVVQHEKDIKDEERKVVSLRLLVELDSILIPHSVIRVIRSLEKTPYSPLANVGMCYRLCQMESMQVQRVELEVRIKNIQDGKSPHEPISSLPLRSHLYYLAQTLEATEKITLKRIEELNKQKDQLIKLEEHALVDQQDVLIEKKHSAVLTKLYLYANQGESTLLKRLIRFFINPIVDAATRKLPPVKKKKISRVESLEETINKYTELKETVSPIHALVIAVRDNPDLTELSKIQQQVDKVIETAHRFNDSSLRDEVVSLVRYQAKTGAFQNNHGRLTLEISNQDKYLLYHPERCQRKFTATEGRFRKHLLTTITRSLSYAYNLTIQIPGVLSHAEIVPDKDKINLGLTVLSKIFKKAPYAGDFLSDLIGEVQNQYDQGKKEKLIPFLQRLGQFLPLQHEKIAEEIAQCITEARGFFTASALENPEKTAEMIAKKMFIRYYAALLHDPEEVKKNNPVDMDNEKNLIDTLVSSILVYSPPAKQKNLSQRVKDFFYGIEEKTDGKNKVILVNYAIEQPAVVLEYLVENGYQKISQKIEKSIPIPAPQWISIYLSYLTEKPNDKEGAFLYTINHYRKLCDLPPLAELQHLASQKTEAEMIMAKRARSLSFENQVEMTKRGMQTQLIDLVKQLEKIETWGSKKKELELMFSSLVQAEKLQEQGETIEENVELSAALEILKCIRQHWPQDISLETLLQRCLMPSSPSALIRNRSIEKTEARRQLIAAVLRLDWTDMGNTENQDMPIFTASLA